MVLLPFLKTPLQHAVRRLARGEDLESVLEPFDDYRIASTRDAEALVEALRLIPRVAQMPLDRYRTSPLHRIVAMFQQTDDKRAADVLREKGVPELVRIFRASFPPRENDDDDLMFLLKILVMLRVPEACELLVLAAAHPATRNLFLWTVVLSQLGEDHPHADSIVAALSDPLPEEFAGIGLLELANERARRQGSAHPFDNAEGLRRLENFLSDPAPEHFSHALSATAAIPFLHTPSRRRLLDLAAQHPDPPVRMEAHWVAATLGDEKGIQALADAARDPRKGSRAIRYLEELGRLDALPAEAATDDHYALAEMADWLAYPTEFNAFPDALRIYDTRELFWPPTNDRRRLWLIEYTYTPSEDRPDGYVGIGMVGSITFALFGETNPGASPEDLYGIHCAWELQTNEDPRAPEDRTAVTGRKILGI